MSLCFRCGCPKPDDGGYLCSSCSRTFFGEILARQPKRFQGLAEKELARNKKEVAKRESV
jgi:hypothetical protein